MNIHEKGVSSRSRLIVRMVEDMLTDGRVE